MPHVKFGEKSEAILEWLRKGVGVTRASEMESVSRQSVFNWMKRGAQEAEAGEDTEYSRFYVQARAAIAQTGSLMERSVLRAAVNNWQAAAWWLERNPATREEYGSRGKLEVQVRTQMTAEFLDYVRDRLDADTYRKVLAALAPEGGGDTPGGLALVE